MSRARRAVGDVGDTPGAIEALAVGAAVASAAGVVDVEHGETAARVELHTQLEAGIAHGGGAAVREHEGRRGGLARAPALRIARRVVDAVDDLAVRTAELAHLAPAQEARI